MRCGIIWNCERDLGADEMGGFICFGDGDEGWGEGDGGYGKERMEDGGCGGGRMKDEWGILVEREEL